MDGNVVWSSGSKQNEGKGSGGIILEAVKSGAVESVKDRSPETGGVPSSGQSQSIKPNLGERIKGGQGEPREVGMGG